MNYTYNYTYNQELSSAAWKCLRDFCKLVVSKNVCASFDEQPSGRSFTILDDQLPMRGLVLHNIHSGDGDACNSRLGSTAVAVLMAAQQSGRVRHWHSSGDVNDMRVGVEMYYGICDEYAREHGHQWWLPSPAVKTADIASAFHVKWGAVEDDVALMVTAAQALTALSSARGGCPLLHLLEELNEILMEHFDLDYRPLSEDLESVDKSDMLEKWRDEMFEIVVHGRI